MSPPRRLAKLPMKQRTRRNESGRLKATVNAAMPPELEPLIARSLGSEDRLYCLPTSGRISSSRKRAYRVPSESYSNARLKRGCCVSDQALFTPGLMKTPIVTGISPEAIKLSKTTGTLQEP